jgi:hypothetical protein
MLFVAGLSLLASFLPTSALRPAAADDWEDPRLERLEGEIRRLRGEGPRVLPSQDGSLVTLRHGDVFLVADLARVDMTLEVQNQGGTPLEWRRTFAVDPRAEAIGASLEREDEEPVEARTLTIEDARRLYDEVRAPRPPPRTTGGQRNPWGPWSNTQDPLRVERVRSDLLELVVWPVAPQETLRVRLTFVTPLRGRGDLREYVDVIRADLGAGQPDAALGQPVEAVLPADGTVRHQWLVHPGALEVVDEPRGMVAAGKAGGVLRFVSAPRTGRGPAEAPTIPFRRPSEEDEVLSVRGGGLGTRIAVWRFDPARYLRAKGVAVRGDMQVRILRREGSTSRIAPWTFAPGAEPTPVTARLLPENDRVRYAVEVRDLEGNVLHLFEEDRPIADTALEPQLEGAVTGWHRAALARRVMAWGGGDGTRGEEALAFAVDLGVLLEGTAGLAIPSAERRLLSRESRRLYHQDGAPLGAQGREADMRWPPNGSVTP